ncbi:BrnT family toxin, partial [Haematobacter massiliensis]|uniref:BrnT family toxin n=2 Tax=Haematobacter massiliensis TaxID=195105 RepID=UPI0030B825E1
VYIKPMKLDWDDAKRDWTLRERGLDFASVAEADWDNALTAEDLREDYAERRFVSLVPIRNRLCVVAWCIRGDALRVISLRKANTRERKRYEQE